MYFVRACFTGAETLDNMIGQNSFVHRFAPCALCLLHNRAGIFRITTKACNIQLMLGLILVLRIVQKPVQITLCNALGLAGIACVIQTPLKVILYRFDFRIGYVLPPPFI